MRYIYLFFRKQCTRIYTWYIYIYTPCIHRPYYVTFHSIDAKYIDEWKHALGTYLPMVEYIAALLCSRG